MNSISTLIAYAEANYTNGMDTFVECYSVADYQELLDENGGDVDATKAFMDEIADVYRDRQADARNSSF